MSVLKDHIFRLALARGIPSRVISVEADSYLCPEPSWITDQFGPELQSFFEWNGIKYREGQFVCRDFGLTAVTLAKLIWFKTRPSDDAIALGMFGLLDREHKINVAVHRDLDESLRFGFYEPQARMADVQLTPEDLTRCCAFQFL